MLRKVFCITLVTVYNHSLISVTVVYAAVTQDIVVRAIGMGAMYLKTQGRDCVAFYTYRWRFHCDGFATDTIQFFRLCKESLTDSMRDSMRLSCSWLERF